MADADGQLDLSLPFDSQPAAVGIGGTIRAKRTTCAVRIVDGVWRKPRPIPTIGIAGRIGIVWVSTQLSAVVALLIIEPWRVVREGIPGRLIAERTAVRTERIVDSVRRKGTPRPVRIGRGVLLIRIGTQVSEVFCMDGER